jgi:hypothetical protein
MVWAGPDWLWFSAWSGLPGWAGSAVWASWAGLGWVCPLAAWGEAYYDFLIFSDLKNTSAQAPVVRPAYGCRSQQHPLPYFFD